MLSPMLANKKVCTTEHSKVAQKVEAKSKGLAETS
jgi:hypothetical protein